MHTIDYLSSLIEVGIVEPFRSITLTIAVTLIITSCSHDQVDNVAKADPGLMEIVSKDTINAPAQSLTIYTDHSARLFNGGSAESFEINLSTKAEDLGFSVNMNYKGNTETLMSGIESLDPTRSGGYVLNLRSASHPIILSSKTSKALLVDSTNKVSFKTFTSTSLLWERITVEDVGSEDAAIEKYIAFMNSLRGGNAKIMSVFGRGVNNQIVVNNNLLKLDKHF